MTRISHGFLANRLALSRCPSQPLVHAHALLMQIVANVVDIIINIEVKMSSTFVNYCKHTRSDVMLKRGLADLASYR
jgi:hypothetical protein